MSIESKVSEKDAPFLHSWDSRVRKYNQFFTIHSMSARDNLQRLQASPLTNWRELTKRHTRYHEVDSLALRQQLGEITPAEVGEVNRVLGGNIITGYAFTRSSKEPALLQAWHKAEFLSWLGLSSALAGYGRFVKGYNNLWLLAPVLSMTAGGLVQMSRQPHTLIDNAYRYLIAKRAATAEFEANQAKMMANSWAQSAEWGTLSTALSAKGETLYDLEARLVNEIEKGTFNKQ